MSTYKPGEVVVHSITCTYAKVVRVMANGQLRVRWGSGNVTTVNASDVMAVNRAAR